MPVHCIWMQLWFIRVSYCLKGLKMKTVTGKSHSGKCTPNEELLKDLNQIYIKAPEIWCKNFMCHVQLYKNVSSELWKHAKKEFSFLMGFFAQELNEMFHHLQQFFKQECQPFIFGFALLQVMENGFCMSIENKKKAVIIIKWETSTASEIPSTEIIFFWSPIPINFSKILGILRHILNWVSKPLKLLIEFGKWKRNEIIS